VDLIDHHLLIIYYGGIYFYSYGNSYYDIDEDALYTGPPVAMGWL
jgi:hypothetical protein